MILGDTIAALATGWAGGPRAMIRLSGAGSPGVLGALGADSPSGRGTRIGPARLTLPVGSLPVLVTVFHAPSSYTGEDGAEVQFAGGTALTRAVLGAVLSVPGVRPAQPGEFTARAFVNGRLSAEKAEGVAAVIGARSAEELSAVRGLLSGKTGVSYRRLRDELADLLALVEAGIDFTDQEGVVAISSSALVARADMLASELRALLGGHPAEARGGAVPVVALAGPPNAGKSTLFNALLGRDRAVVSPAPGTTRDAVRERWRPDTGGWRVTEVELVDIAGLDAGLSARSETDALAQRAALALINECDVVVWCDPRDGGGQSGPPEGCGATRTIRVRTKADRGVGEGSACEGVLPVCAIDGWNLSALRRAIAEAAEQSRSHGSARAALLPRHRAALVEATERVAAASASAAPIGAQGGAAPARPELVAAELRGALDAMGQLAGHVSPDEVIGRIFATFCVGK